MLREKCCKYCNLYFQYEDGIDTHGVAVRSQDSRISVSESQRRQGYCPQCNDPHRIRGMSYYKSTILKSLGVHLTKQGIKVEFLDKDTLIEMLKQFPKSYQIFTSNGSFRTFTLMPGLEFDGKYGKFRLGDVRPYHTKQFGIRENREIICTRCNFITAINTKAVLKYYLGMELKSCQTCDSQYIDRTCNLPIPVKSEYSDITLARALNVSRNDFRRHIITKPEPPLPNGSIVNGLRINESFWDEETYSPRYSLICDRCKLTFTILQKRVSQLQHFC